MLLGALYLLLWAWDRWRAILPGPQPDVTRCGELRTIAGILIAAAVGLQG